MPAAHPKTVRAAAAALALLLALVLSGCVKLNGDLKIDRDLTVSGAMSVEIERSALKDISSWDSSSGGSDYEGELDDSIAEERAKLPQGVRIEKIADETYVGMRYIFEEADPNDVTIDSTSLSGMELSRSDDEIRLRMPNALRALTQAPFSGSDFGGVGAGGPSMSSMFDEATMTFTFPGRVIEAPGATIDGRTATFDLKSFDGEELAVTAKAWSFPWWILYLIGGVLLAALLVLGIVLGVRATQRKRRQNAAAGGFGAGGVPAGGQPPGGQPGGGQPWVQPGPGQQQYQQLQQPYPQAQQYPPQGSQQHPQAGQQPQQQYPQAGQQPYPQAQQFHGQQPQPLSDSTPGARREDGRSRFAPPAQRRPSAETAASPETPPSTSEFNQPPNPGSGPQRW